MVAILMPIDKGIDYDTYHLWQNVSNVRAKYGCIYSWIEMTVEMSNAIL